MAIDVTSAEGRPKALDAATMAEAFQLTAAEHADQVAIRTKDDEFTITWGGYADRVREVAAGLAAKGVGRGDTVGIMMTNRPEFHFIDTAALHLGATPFSIYNTSTPEQIGYLARRRREPGPVHRAGAARDRARRPRRGLDRRRADRRRRR